MRHAKIHLFMQTSLWMATPILILLAFEFLSLSISVGTNTPLHLISHSGPSELDLVLGLLLVGGIFNLFNHCKKDDQIPRRNYASRDQQAALILDTAADAILSVNNAGMINYWNAGATFILGYSAREAQGCPLVALFGGNAAAEVEVAWILDTTQSDGYIRLHDTTVYHAVGHALQVEMTTTRLDNPSGQPIGVSIILRDVTRRKHLETETKTITAHLHDQTIQKTRELADKVEQLAHANHELKQLDQTRSEFVSLVSHQIRAPLTNMIGAVQRMQTDCRAVNPTCNRMFEIFEQQVQRLDRLVQNVLNATRIEAGQLILELEPLSTLPIVQQTLQQFEARTRAREIMWEEKPGLPMIYADRDRVVEILSNLLDNADKYAYPQTPIEVEIRADENYVIISVRDHGPGLQLQDMDRVFDKFYRTDSSDSQTAYGYGLGLYVCRRLAEAQNGRIWAENHVEQGAIFSIAFRVWEG